MPHMTEPTRTPDEWCSLLGVQTLSREGWTDGTRDWDDRIDLAEFFQRLAECSTIHVIQGDGK